MYEPTRRESHYSDINEDDAMLVDEPYTCDPEASIKRIKARKYEMSPRPSISSVLEDLRPYCQSPTPYAKPNMGNLRDKFLLTNATPEKGFKKRAAPKPPGESYSDQLEQRQAKKGPAPQRPVSPYQAPKTDPIREMEKIGKKQVCK